MIEAQNHEVPWNAVLDPCHTTFILKDAPQTVGVAWRGSRNGSWTRRSNYWCHANRDSCYTNLLHWHSLQSHATLRWLNSSGFSIALVKLKNWPSHQAELHVTPSTLKLLNYISNKVEVTRYICSLLLFGVTQCLFSVHWHVLLHGPRDILYSLPFEKSKLKKKAQINH